MDRSPGTYTQGTIYGQVGTTKIVGQGTSWIVTDESGASVSPIAQFDEFKMPGQPAILIESIDDDTHITLGSPLLAGIPAGSPYKIIKRTVSPTTGTLGLLQKIMAIGTAASPLGSEVFDNGTTCRAVLGFDDQGRFQVKVGASGADGSPTKPFHSGIVFDPATGTVSATGLQGGAQASGFNHLYYVTGKPPNSLGVDGDLSFDFVSGFVVYGPKAGGAWPAGLDVFQILSAAVKAYADDAAASAAEADNAATVAANNAALANAWANTPDNTDVPTAPAGSRSARHWADTAGAIVGSRAAKGANSDITSLSALTTPLSIPQGGTGAATALAAINALGGVQRGTGVGQISGNIIKLGWSGSALKATVDATDLGQLWTDYATAQSFSGNGYHKLPSGLLVQWGTNVVDLDANGACAIPFPAAHPNAPFRVLPINGDQQTGPLLMNINASGYPTKTAFSVRVWRTDTAAWFANGRCRVDWISLGF